MATKVITGKVRGSYVNLIKPRTNEMNGKQEYSLQVLVPKSDEQTVAALKAAAKEAIASKWPTPPKGLRNPLRDGDTETKQDGTPLGPEYAGHYFFNAKCSADKHKPTVIDTTGNDLFEPDSVKSGDYFRVSVNAYAYDAAGNRGVSYGLNNVQLVQKGEALGGTRVTAHDEFGVNASASAKPALAVAVAEDDWA
jgi:hypothetical protein